MKTWLLVFNPGSRAGARVYDEFRAIYRRFRLPEDVQLEEVAVPDLADSNHRPDRIIAVGGDGTVNVAARWRDEHDLTCPLAIIPAGTGNNLARGLDLPLAPVDATRIALESQWTRAVDEIHVRGENGRSYPLLQSGALGFPAKIAARYDRLRTRSWLRASFRPLGPYVYRVLSVFGLLSQVREEKREGARLQVDCEITPSGGASVERLAEDVFAIFIGNESSLGGNFRPCPRAQVDDGLLDLCFVRVATLSRYRKIFQQVVRGTHLDATEEVLYRQSRGPVILRLSRSVPMLIDGDLPLEGSEFTLEIHPGRLPIVVDESRIARDTAHPT